MIDALLDLPAHLRRRLVSALETGVLPPSCPAAFLASVLGLPEGSEEIAGGLRELATMGITGLAAGAWLRTTERAALRSPKPDLVWSGPEVSGVHARNTRNVYEELLGSAERSVWARSLRARNRGHALK